jgi:ubiquinone/menaquinone biosynthesis C-methylase UbiE
MFSDPKKNIEQFGVDPGLTVADLGSGGGFYSLALAAAVGKQGRVFAVDVQQDLLTKLKSEAVQHGFENIDIIWGDVDEPNGTRLQDASVDRVLIANILFQVDHRDMLATEAYRILKPKGRVLLVDWSDSFGGLGPHPARIVTATQGRAIFEQAGFTYIRDIQAGDHHYGMVFSK